jgi:pimeloyl-ACP methyl ester carboxylesterase
MLTERVQQWRDAGELTEIAGHRLYVQHREGTWPLLMFLHGFPSSSYDWRALVNTSTLPNAVLLFDFLGFGLSDKPTDHRYALGWQADAVEELIRRAGGPPSFVIAHDMGTSVATELMARSEQGELTIDLQGLLLFNGSILLDQASLTLSQRALRSRLGPVVAALSNQRTFRAQFARLFSPDHPLTRDEADDQWSLLTNHRGHTNLHRAIYYLHERERLVDRWHGAFRDWPGSLSLAWGLRDPVATTHVLEGLQTLRPGVPVYELAGLGHYPQIEDPSAIAAVLTASLSP